MDDEILLGSLLKRIDKGEHEINIHLKGVDPRTARGFEDAMMRLDMLGLIDVKSKEKNGLWKINGITKSGEQYLQSTMR